MSSHLRLVDPVVDVMSVAFHAQRDGWREPPLGGGAGTRGRGCQESANQLPISNHQLYIGILIIRSFIPPTLPDAGVPNAGGGRLGISP